MASVGAVYLSKKALLESALTSPKIFNIGGSFKMQNELWDTIADVIDAVSLPDQRPFDRDHPTAKHQVTIRYHVDDDQLRSLRECSFPCTFPESSILVVETSWLAMIDDSGKDHKAYRRPRGSIIADDRVIFDFARGELPFDVPPLFMVKYNHINQICMIRRHLPGGSECDDDIPIDQSKAVDPLAKIIREAKKSLTRQQVVAGSATAISLGRHNISNGPSNSTTPSPGGQQRSRRSPVSRDMYVPEISTESKRRRRARSPQPHHVNNKRRNKDPIVEPRCIVLGPDEEFIVPVFSPSSEGTFDWQQHLHQCHEKGAVLLRGMLRQSTVDILQPYAENKETKTRLQSVGASIRASHGKTHDSFRVMVNENKRGWRKTVEGKLLKSIRQVSNVQICLLDCFHFF